NRAMTPVTPKTIQSMAPSRRRSRRASAVFEGSVTLRWLDSSCCKAIDAGLLSNANWGRKFQRCAVQNAMPILQRYHFGVLVEKSGVDCVMLVGFSHGG